MGSRSPTARKFRSTTILRVAVMGAALLFCSVLATIPPSEAPLLFTAALVLAGVSVAGVAEAWLSCVEVGPEVITVRGLLSRKQYARSDVEGVNWEKGAGVSLRLSGGGWAKLPDLGHSSQAVAGAVRAWLAKSVSELRAVEQPGAPD